MGWGSREIGSSSGHQLGVVSFTRHAVGNQEAT